MNAVVSYARDGELAVVTVDNPPVNATSHAVRAGLDAAFAQAVADDCAAVVLRCAGRTFIAGADITEFGKPPQPPGLADVLDRIEAFAKPVIAAVHGTALGGGLETAMAAHYRIAQADARLGLPEVNLGLLPGAGGTQRAPRLMGVTAALEFMISGAPIGAAAAQAAGLVDRVVADDLLAAATTFARELLAAGRGPRPTLAQALPGAAPDAAWFEQQRAAVRQRTRGASAPQSIIDAVELGLRVPYAESVAATRTLFLALMNSTESKARRHLFFAEREAARLPADCRAATRRAVERVAVIGGGTMGVGIALNFADAGIPVTVIETDAAGAARALERARENYAASVQRGRIDQATMDARLACVRASADFADLATVDLVVEAVFEDLDVKQDVFRRLDAVCRPGAILATNTSYQDVNAIAAVTARPADVIGMHYFSPANVMKLLEVVRARQTAPDVVATVMDLAKRVRKIPVLVGVCYGFVGNRLLQAYGREVQNLLLEGAMPVAIDAAMEAFGMAMGPLAVTDLAGIDIGYKARKARTDLPDDPRYFRIGNRLAERGWLGQKTGRGYYRYEPGGRGRQVDPEVEQLIRDEARALGIAQRTIASEEIVERVLLALVNEGARALAEGIAQRASDIDIIYTNGYGFPVARGGPMFHAMTLGLDQVCARLDALRERTGDAAWDAAPLLRERAATGRFE